VYHLGLISTLVIPLPSVIPFVVLDKRTGSPINSILLFRLSEPSYAFKKSQSNSINAFPGLTILIAALPPVVRQNGTPRAVAPLVPMGANAGEPGNVEQQTQILEATLEQLVKIPSAGKIVPLPFEYIAHV